MKYYVKLNNDKIVENDFDMYHLYEAENKSHVLADMDLKDQVKRKPSESITELQALRLINKWNKAVDGKYLYYV